MQGGYHILENQARHVSRVHYLSSFTTQLYNHYRTVAENLMKYVPPDGFFGIQIS